MFSTCLISTTPMYNKLLLDNILNHPTTNIIYNTYHCYQTILRIPRLTPPLSSHHRCPSQVWWRILIIINYTGSRETIGYASLWDYRRDLNAGDTSIQILESPFLKTSAPLLEHSYDSYGTLGDVCNLHYFLWDYRRDLDTGDTSI